MDLADEGGIESVTMRELGRRLGVEAASLYNHVAGKDDLLDGMADLVVAEIDLPSQGVDWREAMRRRAVSAGTLFARHRWAAALIDSREEEWARAAARTPIESWARCFTPGSPRDSPRTRFSRSTATSTASSGSGPAIRPDDEDTTEVAQEVLAAIPDGEFPSLARRRDGVLRRRRTMMPRPSTSASI